MILRWVFRDVQEGRPNLNFSRWDVVQGVDVREILDVVRGDGMPPLPYKLIHAKARLSSAARKRRAAGLAMTLAADPPTPGGRGGGG